MKGKREYLLDNSAIIHLVTRKKWYSNSYRMTVTLKADVDPKLLQQAFEIVVPRFPTIAAGIRKSLFRYTVVPVERAPEIRKDGENLFLSCMTSEDLSECAMRIQYGEKTIAGEFFHSLTDGHGAMVFMNTLLAEYLKLAHEINSEAGAMILEPSDFPAREEIQDDFYTYAGRKKAPLSSRRSYQIPGKANCRSRIATTSLHYEIKDLLEAARKHHASLTVFLTAVMASSVAEIQKKYSRGGRCRKPVQIMVPVNLRNLFPSETLRNFSLYALPCVEPEQCELSVKELVPLIAEQLKKESSPEYMAAVMATHTKADQAALMKLIPVSLKIQILKAVQLLYGEPKSCISLSNLGNLVLPEEIRNHVKQAEFFLTPRLKSPYNCVLLSYEGTCIINFSRFCQMPELETVFKRKLQQAMGI